MLFNSPEFLFVFLPLVVAGFYFLRRFQSLNLLASWLLTASMVFYGYWYPQYLPLIAGAILFNYGAGLLIERADRWRKLWFIIGISANLAGLFYFKYTVFVLDSLNMVVDTGVHWESLALPLGISFFTFQKIAYLVDVYIGRKAEKNALAYGTFVLFFPQLIAGPIVHYSEILPQLRELHKPQPVLHNLAVGLSILAVGLFKKAVIADSLAPWVKVVFAAAEAGKAPGLMEAWLGALAYTFQLYFDFSGYSDMAVGLGLMFGIRLPVNFWSPYKATSLIDFWRRWHMTLSRFLRDYLYIPLGGNRKGPARRYLNLLLTMLLGGIWHGAGWTFVLWGALHGLGLACNHLWREQVASRIPVLRRIGSGGWLPTFGLVVVAWVLFRAESLPGAILILQGMSGANGLWATVPQAFAGLSPGLAFPVLAGLGIWCALAPNTIQIFRRENPALGIPDFDPPAASLEDRSLWRIIRYRLARLAWRPAWAWSLLTALLLVAALLTLTQISEFIYFDF